VIHQGKDNGVDTNIINALVAESKRLKGLADDIDSLVAKFSTRAGPLPVVVPRDKTPLMQQSSLGGDGAGDGGNHQVAKVQLTQAEIIDSILKASPTPLTKAEILTEAQRGGFHLKAQSVASVLSREERFESAGEGKWRLKPSP
jgi:hypothetical protein